MADAEIVWQDREIRFDMKPAMLNNRKGEEIIDSINSVEDTKGNNGARGSLLVTNLRIIWVCHANPKVNLSIGHNTILTANIRKAKSKLKGTTQALCVMAKYSAKYEFVFTSLVKNSPRLFTTVQTVMRAYETSSLYRELKLRGSILKDGEVMLLPLEKVFSKHDGVWNLSSDQGNLGTFFITNVRLVWHANLAENFNVSIPYMQMKVVRVRDSKFGQALVIETSQRCGGYILGFRVDPIEQLQAVFQEVQSLHKVFSNAPVFGVDFSTEEKAQPLSELKVERQQDDVEIIDTETTADPHTAYFAERGDSQAEREIVYSSELGLAIEKLPEGVTARSLWSIL